MHIKIVILLLVYYSIFIHDAAISTPVLPKKTPSQALIESIPRKDRGYFILFHLTIGLIQQKLRSSPVILNLENLTSNFPEFGTPNIPDDKYEHFKNITAPADFPRNLLLWTKSNFNVTNVEIANFITYSVICLPQGTCFDPNDVGSMCCPF